MDDLAMDWRWSRGLFNHWTHSAHFPLIPEKNTDRDSLQHWALIPVFHHRFIGFGGRRIYSILILTVGLREASSIIKTHLGTQAQNIICVFLFTHGHTVTGIKERSETIQPDVVEHIRSWLLFRCFIRCGKSMLLNVVTLFLKGQ